MLLSTFWRVHTSKAFMKGSMEKNGNALIAKRFVN